jgi:hypothetical protein
MEPADFASGATSRERGRSWGRHSLCPLGSNHLTDCTDSHLLEHPSRRGRFQPHGSSLGAQNKRRSS